MNQPSTALSYIRILIQASRPKTLIASFFPALAGILLAMKLGFFQPVVALATIACSVLLQVLTNYANDYFDFKKGADTHERLGPQRVTQTKLLNLSSMKQIIIVTVFLCLLLGVYLVLEGGFPILAIGILSILFAIGYTAGPYPLAYHGWGEVFSFVFFGIVACTGSFFLQTHHFDWTSVAAGTLFGFLSVALIVANNLRDCEQDRKVNKKTIVVRLGENFGRIVFSVSIYGTILGLVIFILLKFLPWTCLIAILPIPQTKRMSQFAWTHSRRDIVPLFPQIAKYYIIYGTLLNLGLAISFYI